ncbi:MAG: tetratricopeptide repeat protein [Cytophagales bacterium]|nr:tetratricopeptide repeat protein [Cytophagales bacterium]
MYKTLRLPVLCLALLLGTAWASAQTSSYENDRRQVDSLRRLLEQDLPPAQALQANLKLAGYYIDFSQLDSVQICLDEGFRLNELVKDSIQGFFLTAYQTEIFLYSTLCEQGIQTAMKGLQQAEQLNDEEMIANQYNLLGLLYAEMAQFQQAIGFFELSLNHLPPQSGHDNLTRRYHLLSNLAQCYEELNDIPTAIRYNLSSLREARREKRFRGMSIACWSLGNIYYAQGDYHQAKAYYQQSLRHSESIRDVDVGILVYPRLFHVYEKLKNHAMAQKALQQGIDLAEREIWRIKPNSQKQFYTEVNRIYQQIGDYRNVVAYQQKLDNISQEITRQENKQRLAVLNAFYANEKRMVQMAAQTKEHEIQLQQQRSFLRYAVVFALLAVAALGAIYYAFRQKQRLKNWQLRQQITELEQQQEMSALRAMVEGEEQERMRIARELHDGLTGLLSAARHQVESAFRRLPQTDTLVTSPAAELLDKACGEVRRISHNLMPYALQRHGLATALQEYCANVQQSGLLAIDYQQISWHERLSPSLELWLYRMAQELINNALRHAKATHALVQLSRHGNSIHITVEDDGRGFNFGKINAKSGTGLKSIESRVKYMNGSLSVNSDSRGTSVQIEISLSHVPIELNS